MAKAEMMEHLKKRFDISDHEVRKGTRGKWYVYIKKEAIIHRLDDVAPMDWHTKIESSMRVEDRVEVIMSMTIAGVTRCYNGVAEDNRNQSGVLFPLNTAKAAATDAFKRVASMFGVGLYLQGCSSINASSKQAAMADFRKWFQSTTETTADNSKWDAQVKANFASALTSRFPTTHQAVVLEGMGLNGFSEIGTVEEAANKVISWCYENHQPFIAGAVMYSVNNNGKDKCLVFRVDNDPDSKHIAVRAYGRSTTVKNWIGDYAYMQLGLDDIKSNTWLSLVHPVTVFYESKNRNDGSVYYIATGIGHNINDPQLIEDNELEY
jgi:hypothetical protein